MTKPSREDASQPNRRHFLGTSAALSAAVVSGVATSRARAANRAANDTINLALVGCGGRGTGAVGNSLSINDNVRLVAVADLFLDKCVGTVKALTKMFPEKIAVPENKMFTGLDAYSKILDEADVDVVLFATPPGFRPYHIEAAVKAGKHVFAEKPSCVDPAGYRVCAAAHKQAVANGTAIVTGTQYRRQTNYVEAVNRIHDGMIGDIVSATTRYCAGGIWYRARDPEKSVSDTQYELSNWMHFIWLSGDQICEQAVHNIDAINWVMGSPPVSAYGCGGRFTRPEDSEMWDNVEIDYEYPGNKILSFMCRQIPGTEADNGNVIFGTKGTAYIPAYSGTSRILDRDGKELWKEKGSIAIAYQQEHKDLIDSIRAGTPIVELIETANSSLTAVMGRMAAYTGQRVTWDFVTKQSKLDLFPKDLDWNGARPKPQFAIPGVTKLI